MPPQPCQRCAAASAVILRPRDRSRLCRQCFLAAFEAEVHDTIEANRLFAPGERVAIAASGGKDSTVLAAVLATLNERHGYGLRLELLSVDEGITGYRDDSLEAVKRNAAALGLPLTIVGYRELYGWTMDEVVGTIGKKGNCTYCGVFRRQALDRGAAQLGVRHVVTGHNADDMAETVLMNLTASATSAIKRSKPLKYAYEKEIVLYAHHQKLDYFSTECIYSPEAFRGSARALIKDLEQIRPSAILDVVRSGEDMARCVPPELAGAANCGEDEQGAGCGAANGRDSGGEISEMERKLRQDEIAASKFQEVEIKSVRRSPGQRPEARPAGTPKRAGHMTAGHKTAGQQMRQCERCGYMSSQPVCKACTLLEGLNRNRPRTGIAVDEISAAQLVTAMDRIAVSDAVG